MADVASPTTSMRLDELEGRAAYRILTSLVIPRPIAWVSTVSKEGAPNLAPFSFFNLVTGSPPTVMISVGSRRTGEPKDTLANVREVGEFVVNLADETLAVALNETSAPVEPGVSEFERAGLEAAPSTDVTPPRVADAPAALECRVTQLVPVDGSSSTMILGRVLRVHVREDLLAPDGLVDAERFAAISRLGRDEYATLGSVFRLDRPAR